MKHLTTKNEKQTLAFARRVARQLKGGDLLLLQGELGAGKTTFVRGLARALGIKSRIKSPTFTLMHIHRILNSEFRIQNFVHCDAYRIKDARALEDIGLMDYLGRPDTVVVVEWGEKIKTPLKGKKHFVITFHHGKEPNERIVSSNF